MASKTQTQTMRAATKASLAQTMAVREAKRLLRQGPSVPQFHGYGYNAMVANGVRCVLRCLDAAGDGDSPLTPAEAVIVHIVGLVAKNRQNHHNQGWYPPYVLDQVIGGSELPAPVADFCTWAGMAVGDLLAGSACYEAERLARANPSLYGTHRPSTAARMMQGTDTALA